MADIIDYRIESEFFLKRFVCNEDIVKSRPHYLFQDCFVFTNGRPFEKFLSKESQDNFDYSSFSISVAKIGDVTNKTNTEYWDKVCLDEFAYHKSEFLSYGDILMTLTGDPPDIGKVTYVNNHRPLLTWNQRVAKINILNYDEVLNSEFAYILLASSHCRTQIERNAKGLRQRNLGNEGLNTIIIPKFSKSFQQAIQMIVFKGENNIEQSKEIIALADNMLLCELELNDWQPTKETTTEKCFTDFLSSGRLDAEYYQPKYDELFEHLSKYETKKLGEIAVISKSIEPGSDAYQSEGVPFIRVSNLSKYGLSQPDIYLDALEFGEDEVIRPRKDTILLSKDGSVGIAYKVQEDMNSITSGAILHLNLRDDEFLPDYVTLVLNSIIVKMQAERDAGGSIIQHWKPSEIEQVIIPKLSIAKQQEITTKIQESFALRAESKRLLDLAKRAVEIAIEQGEDEGLKLLK